MTSSLEDEVSRIAASVENEEQNSQEQETPGTTEQETGPCETIHVHYFPDAIVIVKEEEVAQVVDSTPVIPQKISFLPAYMICCFSFFLIVSTLAFQVYEILNHPVATVTIIPNSKIVTLNGTLQLGWVVSPLTISQSQAVLTTGKGHQDARSATGFITFYNGLFTAQTIQAGTILTGADGIQVVTDQDAVIPSANPPNLGQITVPAHVTQTGGKGNIPSFDMNTPCCLTAVKAVNTQPFSGGADERDFQTVAKSDIDTTAATLRTAVAHSMQGAFSSQLTPQERVQLLPCTPTQTADHQPGQEATHVSVTVSETCSAVAYNSQELERKATDELTRQAATKIGTSDSLLGVVQVVVNQATIAHATIPLVILSFHAQGTWIYGLSHTAQQQIKQRIAGKTKREALHIVASLPGVEQASISWGDDMRLPKNSSYIHITVVVVE